mmetsp:Transcript_34076/g.97402  ORF Transcript_34076/g.97402 Transcript_34076/m.97402 type:complete len:317 (+) Transcript_34076:966-1916(+)
MRPCRLRTCRPLASGGRNRSPSSRLSQRLALKTLLSSSPSSPRRAEGLGPCSADQKAPPARPAAAQLPSGPSASCACGAETAPPNLSRFRSTPRGARASAGIVAETTSDFFAETMRLASSSLSRLISTPPYTPYRPCLLAPGPCSRALPSWSWILWYQRSFQSWGIAADVGSRAAHALFATENQDSSSWTSVSTMYLASRHALATSRSWRTTLFRSAIRSKRCVKASAYFTSGWSGRVSWQSSMPFGPSTCSRASTPMLTEGTRAPSSESPISASRTTNHSLAFQPVAHASSSKRSRQLFMPTTGWSHSPMESSLR